LHLKKIQVSSVQGYDWGIVRDTGLKGRQTRKTVPDNQHNDIQHNDTQHNDIQHNDTQHEEVLFATLGINATQCKRSQHNNPLP
jgi:hypothetical protein